MVRHVITCKGLHRKDCVVQTRGFGSLEKTGLVKVIWHCGEKAPIALLMPTKLWKMQCNIIQ